MMDLTLKHISEISVQRGNRWHKGGIEDWSPLEWAGAMAGEAGEACNAAKKLKRVTDGILNINLEEDRSLTDVPSAQQKVAKEVCDTILYGVMAAARVGITGEMLDQLIRDVFNAKSEEYGFPERL